MTPTTIFLSQSRALSANKSLCPLCNLSNVPEDKKGKKLSSWGYLTLASVGYIFVLKALNPFSNLFKTNTNEIAFGWDLLYNLLSEVSVF